MGLTATSEPVDNGQTDDLPPVDLDRTMRSTWYWTKVRIEATIEASLYREIQKIIEKEQKKAQARDWPEVPISHVVDMILRKGVRVYQQEASTE